MPTPRPTTREDYFRRMLRVLVHIQRHLDEPLSLDALAEVACFSRFHFHRIFTGMIGESVKQHIRRLRLERAAMRLGGTDQPVGGIALDAGYESHESFTRAFRAAFGAPPQAYRAETRTRRRIDAPSGVHYAEDGRVASLRPVVGKGREMEVRLKVLEPMRVAFVRHVGPYDEVGLTWERLCDWAGSECMFGPDTRLFGACYDDPEITPPDKVRYDACITVEESVRAQGEIGVQRLGGGRYAVLLHEGPYDKLGESYAALFGRWLVSGNHEPGNPPCFEFYLNDPDSTPPEELLTEVCVPILD